MFLKYLRNVGGLAYFVSAGILYTCSLVVVTESSFFTREMYVSIIIINAGTFRQRMTTSGYERPACARTRAARGPCAPALGLPAARTSPRYVDPHPPRLARLSENSARGPRVPQTRAGQAARAGLYCLRSLYAMYGFCTPFDGVSPDHAYSRYVTVWHAALHAVYAVCTTSRCVCTQFCGVRHPNVSICKPRMKRMWIGVFFILPC